MGWGRSRFLSGNQGKFPRGIVVSLESQGGSKNLSGGRGGGNGGPRSPQKEEHV